MNGILIDINGFKIDFDTLENLQEKELKNGEQIIEQNWNIANGMNKPQWDGEKWIDTEPLPPVETPIQEPNKTEILEANVLNLQKLCIGLQKQIILK